MAKKKKSKSVSIPPELFKKIEDRIEGTGFDSVSEYVTYVLREVVEEEEEEEFSEEDEEKVKERLRALGYLG
ncbi:CopG family transcriptional regulator [candidate division MSBL1 archaeon SCGC-AAA261O19]|uniref:CopG family transcriptional regulator n=1 Tax=candidate division MSBL1 archaeon SCGC-AAA261O19 TaxID=1698277 RepID=A0A133VFB5_9EURY|nr:CopG family transcriptional regulator [candidate division MSBL1 archaeon SCGC-AAA261O19]